MEPEKHARISPSGMAVTVGCHGSVIMQERYPNTPSADSIEGNASHWVAAHMLLGKPYGKVDPAGTVLDRDMVRHATKFAEYVLSIIRHRELLRVEEYIDLPAIHAECGGTPDAHYLDRKANALHIFDYKYGYSWVEAFENWQGLAYAAGIMGVITHLPADFTIHIHIVQPRASHPDGPIRTWSLKVSELIRYVERMAAAARAALEPNPVCTTGKWCKNCRARHECPTLQVSGYDILDLAGPSVPRELTNQQRGAELCLLTRGMALLKARITGLEAQVEADLRAGQMYTTHHLGAGRGATIWDRPNDEVYALGVACGKDLRQDKPITPTQAKDAGIHPDIIKVYSKRIPGKLKLKESDPNQGKKLFGGK